MDKRYRNLVRLARQYDRRVVRRRKHYMLECCRGEQAAVFAPVSPSCPRSMKNVVRDLRQAAEAVQ